MIESGGLKGGGVSDFCCFCSDFYNGFKGPFISFAQIQITQLSRENGNDFCFPQFILALGCFYWFFKAKSQANKRKRKEKKKLRCKLRSNMFQVRKWIKKPMRVLYGHVILVMSCFPSVETPLKNNDLNDRGIIGS